ncbi:MAG: PepSY domain-containing protein [Azoarcus sp.]|jgi:hypothetical protein|nr:PepSY domain-containing protein [Azoarcus sp.]
MKPISLFQCFCAACLLASVPAFADSDHNRAREAVLSGEIMPLEQVLQQVQKVSPGKILKVELEREAGMWVYEIKLLRDTGVLSKQYFDAKSGALLQGKPRRSHFGDWDDDEDDD